MASGLMRTLAFGLLLALRGAAAGVEELSPDPLQLASDDECAQKADGDREQCSLNALQLRAAKSAAVGSAVAAVAAAAEDAAAAKSASAAEAAAEALAAAAAMEGSEEAANATVEMGTVVDGIWHYAQNCYTPCGSVAGYCPQWCGPGNACCRYGGSSDPPECHTVRFFPVTLYHTCTTPANEFQMTTSAPSLAPSPAGEGGAPAPATLIFKNPLLYSPSRAPLMEFYLYRVQSDENYAPENQNTGNLGGMLWYLHNEIVYHKHLERRGTYFATRKTRLEKFRIQVRPTQPLWNAGMHFAVVNAFDTTKCTGPYKCFNFEYYGYAVGCENWKKGGGADFPHGQWDNQNHYPGAIWYSLPGPCPSKGLKEKDAACVAAQPGGACVKGGTPTGAGDCTYTYEKVGEVSISELEGITDEKSFIAMGGEEYNEKTDKGYLNNFWDGKYNTVACERRISAAEALFKTKYPHLEDLPDPTCDFNRWKFYDYMKHR